VGGGGGGRTVPPRAMITFEDNTSRARMVVHIRRLNESGVLNGALSSSSGLTGRA